MTAQTHSQRGASPVIDERHTFGSVGDKVSGLVLERPVSWRWLVSAAAAAILLATLPIACGYLFVFGVGVWGVNVPVGWGLAIVNFVWWIGIGHAGTLISATLLLAGQSWRTSISRFAEAMAVFALAAAGLFPILHLGRPYFFYWLVPYPNTYGVGPQYRSALVWDVFAMIVYVVVVVLFWYVGMIPDFATLRDRAKRRWVGWTFAALALGWRGDAGHWSRYQLTYRLLAGMATALVVMHSAVALDFTVSVVPGWHSTIYPAYFVVGALLSGLAMLLLLAIPLRAIYGFYDLITDRHLQNIAKLLLVTSLIVGCGYVIEVFVEWYSGSKQGWYDALVGMRGPHVFLHWTAVLCNVAAPLPLGFRAVRRSPRALWVISLAVLFGMWLDRFLIVAASLNRDFVASAWGLYSATRWDWLLLVGTVGLFFSMLVLFVRVLPIVSIFETRHLLYKLGESREQGVEAHGE